jgi:hypothetical protein
MTHGLSEQETEKLGESTDSQEMDEADSTAEGTDQTEVLSDSAEESLQSQIHQQTESGPAIFSHGSTNIIINNNYARSIRRVWERPYEGDNEQETNESFDAPADIIERNVRFARQNMAQFDVPLPARPFEEPPADIEQLSEKYYQLEEYARCYILVVALLHGATVREIYLRTDELYRLILEEKYNTLKIPDKKQNTSSTVIASPQLPMFTFPRQASLALQKQTWTVSYREKGAERIFWYDIDSTGHSSFEIRMLTFLAKESAGKGEHWEHFFELVREWSGRKGKRNSQAESPWRSARALGAILWYQDVVELQKLAEDWAKGETFTRRKLAASLLNGAYEAECQKLSTGTQTAVWQLLDQWILKSQKPQYKTDIRLGCVAASTYGLISSSRIPPDIDEVLRKLDVLLQIQEYHLAEYIGTLTATVSSTYVSLSLSGHIRQVLSSLADIAKELVHWKTPRALKGRKVYRQQREIRLDTVLNTFFLIATAMVPDREIALQSQQQSSCSIYTQPLSEDVSFPDPNERDLFLVAILTEDKLATPLRTLLCAAMFAKKSQLTFELISQWTDIILAVQDSQRANATHVYTPFVSFLVNLGKTIEQWSGDLQQRGYRQPVAYEAYQQKFIGWHTSRASKQPLDALARDVLVGLT